MTDSYAIAAAPLFEPALRATDTARNEATFSAGASAMNGTELNTEPATKAKRSWIMHCQRSVPARLR
ncbi:MAG TPA: hypothetical protein VE175_03195 [Woeseiaceae bacterium]|nr:hypothetical protein [Woeseiaceae bacterium]